MDIISNVGQMLSLKAKEVLLLLNHKLVFDFTGVSFSNFADGDGIRRYLAEDEVKDESYSYWHNIRENKNSLEKVILDLSAPSSGLGNWILTDIYTDAGNNFNKQTLNYITIDLNKPKSELKPQDHLSSLSNQLYIFKNPAKYISDELFIDYSKDSNYNGQYIYTSYSLIAKFNDMAINPKYTTLSFTDLPTNYPHSVQYDNKPTSGIITYQLSRTDNYVKTIVVSGPDYKRVTNTTPIVRYKNKIIKLHGIRISNYSNIKPLEIKESNIKLNNFEIKNKSFVSKKDISIKSDNTVINKSKITNQDVKQLFQYKTNVNLRKIIKIHYTLNQTPLNFRINYQIPNLGRIKPIVKYTKLSPNLNYFQFDIDFNNVKTHPAQNNIKLNKKYQVKDFTINEIDFKLYQHDIKYSFSPCDRVYTDFKSEFSVFSSTSYNNRPLEKIIRKAIKKKNEETIEENLKGVAEEKINDEYERNIEEKVIEERSINQEYNQKKENIEEKLTEKSREKYESKEKTEEKYDKKKKVDEKIKEGYSKKENPENISNVIAKSIGFGAAGIATSIGFGAAGIFKLFGNRKSDAETQDYDGKTNELEQGIRLDKVKEDVIKQPNNPIEKGPGYEVLHREAIDDHIISSIREKYGSKTKVKITDNKTALIEEKEIDTDTNFFYTYQILKEKNLDVEIRRGYEDWGTREWVDGLIIEAKDFTTRKTKGFLVHIDGKEVPWESGKENPLLEGKYSKLEEGKKIEIIEVKQGEYFNENAETFCEKVIAFNGQITEEHKGMTIRDLLDSLKKHSEEDLRKKLGEHYDTKVFVADKFCNYILSDFNLDYVIERSVFDELQSKEIQIAHKSYPCNGAGNPLYNLLHEKNKKIILDEENPFIGCIFRDLEIRKKKDNGKIVKGIIEHIFDKPDKEENKIKRSYSINPETKEEELDDLPDYIPDALKKLGPNTTIEIQVNGIKSKLDTRINVGDKLSLAYVAKPN